MRFSRRRSARRSGSVPSRKVWGGFHSVDVDGHLSPFQLDPGEFTHTWILSPTDAQDFYDEPTLLRILWSYAVIPFVTATNEVTQWCCNFQIGIIVTEPDATGDPPFMDPLDTSLQWIYNDTRPMWHHNQNAFAVGFIQGGGGDKGTLDIRAKRKIPEGFGLSALVNNRLPDSNDFTGDGIPFHIYASGRYLLADH